MGGVTAAVVARASASRSSWARMPLRVQQVAGEFPSFSVCLPEGRSVSQSVNHHFQYTCIILYNHHFYGYGYHSQSWLVPMHCFTHIRWLTIFGAFFAADCQTSTLFGLFFGGFLVLVEGNGSFSFGWLDPSFLIVLALRLVHEFLDVPVTNWRVNLSTQLTAVAR